MHGKHIVQSFQVEEPGVYTVSSVSENVYFADVEFLPENGESKHPDISVPALSYEFGASGSMVMSWSAATKPHHDCDRLEYSIFYHEMMEMHTSMVLGTYCGTLHTLGGGGVEGEDGHDEHHGHLRSLDHGEHTSMLTEIEVGSALQGTIPDLDLNKEYHVEVVAICKDSAGVPTGGGSAYQPVSLSGDWFVIDEIKVDQIGAPAATAFIALGSIFTALLASAVMAL